MIANPNMLEGLIEALVFGGKERAALDDGEGPRAVRRGRGRIGGHVLVRKVTSDVAFAHRGPEGLIAGRQPLGHDGIFLILRNFGGLARDPVVRFRAALCPPHVFDTGDVHHHLLRTGEEHIAELALAQKLLWVVDAIHVLHELRPQFSRHGRHRIRLAHKHEQVPV